MRIWRREYPWEQIRTGGMANVDKQAPSPMGHRRSLENWFRPPLDVLQALNLLWMHLECSKVWRQTECTLNPVECIRLLMNRPNSPGRWAVEIWSIEKFSSSNSRMPMRTWMKRVSVVGLKLASIQKFVWFVRWIEETRGERKNQKRERTRRGMKRRPRRTCGEN